MIIEIIKFIFSSFWIWLGAFMMLGILSAFLFDCWNRFIRHMNIRRAGWPPSHLDADGDWKPEPQESKEPQESSDEF